MEIRNRKKSNKISHDHSQAVYTSRLLNSFIKGLPKYENGSIEIVDSTT